MKQLTTSVRRWLVFFIIALFFSGLTAIPLETELHFLVKTVGADDPGNWFGRVYDALAYNNIHYRFLAYGYDWLAFAHFVLAILFIGPYRDPVKNKWVIQFGMIACGLIIPFALVSGHERGIPFAWQLIDCSFGLFGIIPLLIVHRKIRLIEKIRLRDRKPTIRFGQANQSERLRGLDGDHGTAALTAGTANVRVNARRANGTIVPPGLVRQLLRYSSLSNN